MINLFLLIYLLIPSLLFPEKANATEEDVIGLVMQYRAKQAKGANWLAPCTCPRANRFDPHSKSCYWEDAGALDCGGIAYYMCTGKNGNINNIAKKYESDQPNIMDGISQRVPDHHKPYTVYALLTRSILGGFSFQHYFTYLDDGRHISKTGFGPIRIFESFGDMVRKDGFPTGMNKKDGEKTKSVEEVYTADRKACGHNDITFTEDEFTIFRSSLNEEDKLFFQSRIR
jgi:hypothetical protein